MKKQPHKDYTRLHQHSRHAKILSGIESLLSWDQETYMPKNAASIRAEQIKTLAGIIHKEQTSKKFANALERLIDLKTGKILAEELSSEQKRAVELWRSDYLKEKALPAKFVEDFARLSSEGVFAWETAKKENNFKMFLPYLKKVVSMNRKKADYLGFKNHPYDALLDRYEPEMTAAELDKVFIPLRTFLTGLIKKIGSAKQVDDAVFKQEYNPSQQFSFGQKLLEWIGYDPASGRLDISSHPFSTSSHPSDSRITTRIDPRLFISNIRSVLHECGHAFYEMGLPEAHYGSPLGEAVSLGIHESQSRWWETRIGQSKPFCSFLLPHLKQEFEGKLEHLSLDQFWKAFNKVEPSLTRVEADEVTYPLHVMLRYEIEIALIEGTLQPKDLPQAWGEKMQELLGVTPKTDSEGCMQDIHWAMGAFGYFPTYALGNLYAAHLFTAFEKKHPNWDTLVQQGEFSTIKTWLYENIHQHGRRYTGKELLKKATGTDFSSDAYISYLENKYSQIYCLN